MSQDTRTALLDIAEVAARRRGIDGFSFGDLADGVGIRKASVHYHFPTKDLLSVALMKRYRTSMQDTCHDIDRAHASAGARLAAVIEVYRRALGDGDMLCLCASLTSGYQSLSAATVHEINAFRGMMLDWLREVFNLGSKDGSVAAVVQPALEARAMLALLEGAQLAARSENRLDRFDEATALLSARIQT